jgi:hypothetical protein
MVREAATLSTIELLVAPLAGVKAKRSFEAGANRERGIKWIP